jgi:photosystem II biogenesis protein Psp29
VSSALTVADSKRAFHSAFPYVISPLYRRMVDELLVELHLLSRQQGFRPDPLFAVGLVQVFDAFSRGYRPENQTPLLFEALCGASGFDATQLRLQAEAALASVGHHNMQTVRGWIDQRGLGAPEPLGAALAGVQRDDFHYSRLMAVGLLTLLEQAQDSGSIEPQALRQAAHDLGESMGLLRDRVDKDLSLYAGNLAKMAQAVELMEETVAAERRRRERQQVPAAEKAPTDHPASESPSAG